MLSSTTIYRSPSFNILSTVSNILNSDNDLSSTGCEFLPEDLKDIEYSIKKAVKQQGIVGIAICDQLDFIGFSSSSSELSNLGMNYDMTLKIQVSEQVTVNRARKNAITGRAACEKAVYDLINPANLSSFPNKGTFMLTSPIKTAQTKSFLNTTASLKGSFKFAY